MKVPNETLDIFVKHKLKGVLKYREKQLEPLSPQTETDILATLRLRPWSTASDVKFIMYI
jgi:hypothetical protein